MRTFAPCFRAMLTVTLCSALPTFAHEGADGGDDEVDFPEHADQQLAPDAGGVEVIHFSTTIRSTRPSRSASETTIDQDVIQAAPRTGATDVLRLVPGMVASQHSGEGKAQQLFLRGFDAVHGQDVELNVGGLPVNEVSHIHALGYADTNWIIPEAIRELRVTEGSYRAWQGDFAVAGSVRYELGLAEKGFTLAGTVGRFGRYRLFAGFRPFDEPETFAALELVQAEGVGSQRAFGRVSFLGQSVFRLGEFRFRFLVGNMASRFESPGVVRLDAYEAGTAGFFDAFGRFQGGSTSRHQLLASVERATSNGKTSLELFGVLSDLRLRNNFTGFLLDARGDGIEQLQGDAFFGARVEHHHHLTLMSHPLSIDMGLSGRRDGITQQQRLYRDTDSAPYLNQVDAKVTQSAIAGWTEVAWSPHKTRVMLGGRADVLAYEVFDGNTFLTERFAAVPGATRAAFGVHFGVKAGLERELFESFKVFLNYGDGFRSPQARSLADGERAPFVNVHGAEVGASFERSNVQLKAAAFGSYVQNDFFFDHSVGTTVNTGATLRGGGALTVLAKPLEGWLLSGSFTAAHARVLADDTLLPYFAPLVGRLDTSYTKGVSLFGRTLTGTVGLAATFIGPRPQPLGDFSNAVFLIDLRISVRYAFVELSWDTTNLLDSRWRDGEFTYSSNFNQGAVPSTLPARHFTAGSPRQMQLTLEIHL